jgi:hypothetical protein
MIKTDKNLRKILADLKKNTSLKLAASLFCYFILRFIFGPTIFLIYTLTILFFLLRYSFEKIAFIFLFLAIVTYLFGLDAEANRHMSFVYVFLIIVVLKYLWIEIAQLRRR